MACGGRRAVTDKRAQRRTVFGIFRAKRNDAKEGFHSAETCEQNQRSVAQCFREMRCGNNLVDNAADADHGQAAVLDLGNL